MSASSERKGLRDNVRTDADAEHAGISSLQLVSRATYFKEAALKNIFLLCAFVAVMGVLLIFLFVGWKGWPIFASVGPVAFLSGGEWNPTAGIFGILPLVYGSVVVMAGALLIGTPLAVGTAIFLSEVASPNVRAVVRPAVELLAGIPSVIFGFFGLIILRPVVANLSGGLGFGAVTAWFILAIMIVPTIATLSEDALRSVSPGIREASYAMGATTWQTIYKVLVPAAKIGIIDAIILGMGRAIGETMAVLMVVGNAPVIPESISAPVATLTTQIVMDMPYAAGDHRTALFGMAIILFVVSMALVALVRLMSRLQSSIEDSR
ncbi:MAG: phosphate ABC transporter permease subunit PstC [Actinomycetota bacterium]|nr:phosphate ABC transporter permease subunit PstC [Actinomycetota bacterium]